jgi:hypothetical protein
VRPAAGLILAGLLTACAPSGDRAGAPAPARYLFVWAGTGNDSTPGVDLVSVLDVKPGSPGYGRVLAALPVDSAGRMPHHSEFSLPPSGPLFANDYAGDKSFLIDLTFPEAPRLAGRVERTPHMRRLHSFARLANGHVLATVQFGDSTLPGDPGGLAEFDAAGRFVRSTSSADPAFPGARIRTYALTVLPAIDRVVTTSSPMDNERTADVIQIWRLTDLALLKTMAVPRAGSDSAGRFPFELRTLADGRTVFLNTYYCGFYWLNGLDGTPTIEPVLALPHPGNIGCSVPLVVGKFWIMPIAYAHRYATLDISDPSHPREVASLPTDKTFFPHWIAADPGSDRVVVTDQGDGQPLIRIAHLDRSTGRLAWDEQFRDPASTVSAVSFHRKWPNGETFMAMPHAALFVP